MILAALTAAAVALPITLTHSMFELIDRATVRRLDTTAARDGAW